MVINTPTTLRLDGCDRKMLEMHLRYLDHTADFAYRQHKKGARWKLPQMGEQAYFEELNRLKEERNKSLLFEDEQGLWTYSGLAPRISRVMQKSFTHTYEYPEAQLIPWTKVPSKQARPYQQQMLDRLLEARHAGVEVGTGLGKSFVILMLAKKLGLKTVVMAPFKSIADQLYKEFLLHFGKQYVGKFFDGKKEYDRLFTIAVSNSLALVERDSPAWQHLSRTQVFIADESHMCPAVTLAEVCFGLCAHAPYRFFFSGTQMRNDGKDLLLDAIVGDIVFSMTVREGVDQGYLAKPLFRMVQLTTDGKLNSDDANKMTRHHLYYSQKVNTIAGQIANLSLKRLNRQVLILVEEIEQFSMLLPHFRYEAAFAHGGVTKANRDKLPVAYHDSDPGKLVELFNAGKIPILVGTSCISTGTDILTQGTTINLQGGKSEIAVRQGAIGRSTRAPLREQSPENPWWPWGEKKTDCYVWDFDVCWPGQDEDPQGNMLITSKHAKARKAIYDDTYGPVEQAYMGS